MTDLLQREYNSVSRRAHELRLLNSHKKDASRSNSPDAKDRYGKGQVRAIETEPDLQFTMGAGMIEISPAARNGLGEEIDLLKVRDCLIKSKLARNNGRR